MADMPDTQDSLIAQLRDADNFDAWESFARLYRPVVYRLARARGLQHADADDLSQQVMLSVARAIPQWQRDPHARFRHWLARIVRNAIVNALTRSRQDRATGGSGFLSVMHNVPADETEIELQVEVEYQRQVYRRAAEIVRDEVQVDSWRAFVLTVVDGEPTSVVAEQLGKSIGAIHAVRSRIMRRLQNTVRELLEADE
jgi:RNA polymerase sigma-70 factor (ECF subfamily)